MDSYSILVNTCDKFEDCWDPFFKLFKFYWPDCSGKIYLNTEYKIYEYKDLSISSIQGCKKHNVPNRKRATWSQCLRWALETMETDIILYMQEDYFLNAKVNNDRLEELVSLMQSDPTIHCIQLTTDSVKPKECSAYDGLLTVDHSYWSTISCQASLWRKDILQKYIRDYENAWQFEWWGSKRAFKYKDNFFVVNQNLSENGGGISNCISTNYKEIIPYIKTGVIGGRWYRPVVELFQAHDILMDYSKRGFHQEGVSSTWIAKQKRRLKQLPVEIRNRIELLFM